ncbi:MAG: hypothetical protein H2174_03985 [Vampirovibrio sp.]|nr:hypothetical protein [Vampirovibrio sp.]
MARLGEAPLQQSPWLQQVGLGKFSRVSKGVAFPLAVIFKAGHFSWVGEGLYK